MSMTQGLFAFGNNLYAAWKGEVGDDRLFYAVFNGTTWESESVHIPGNSSVGPSLAAPDQSTLYAAWKGENGDADQRLFYAAFDGNAWLPQVQIPKVGSSVGPALGVLKGKLYAAWKGEEGDNQIYWSWLDGSTWKLQKAIPGASSLVGASLAEYDHKLYAGWRGAVGDQSMHFAQFDGSSWEAVPSIPGNPGSSVGPSLAPYGTSLYAAWKGADQDENIYYAAFSNGSWSGATQIPNVGSSIGPALAAFGSDLYAMWKGEGDDQSLYYASFNGSWSSQNTLPGNTGQDVVPTPEGGLAQNHNYWIYSNCNPITDLKVTIVVHEDMVYESTTKGKGKGFAFQLNAFSQIGENIIVGWQQFVFGIKTPTSPQTEFHGQLDIWPVSHTINGISTGGNNLINLGAVVVNSLPSNGVPEGYTLTISLGTDNSSRVNSATFSVTDPNSNNGQPYSTTITTGTPQDPKQLASSLPPQLQGPITDVDLAPILAFQLVLVGPDETHVLLSSGAGTITYSASSPLTALNSPPPCIKNTVTGESTNSVYSTISVGSGTLTQQFWVAN